MNVIISDRLVSLLKSAYADGRIYEKNIKDIVNTLRVDNGMPPLEDNQFDFSFHEGKIGCWNEKKQTLCIQYSSSNPNFYQIFSAVFHEFYHSWQNFYVNDHNLVKETVAKNLNGYFNKNFSEYCLQPCEIDAFNFEQAAMSFVAEKCKINFMSNIEASKNKHSFDIFKAKNEIHSFGYPANDNFLNKLLDFRADVGDFENEEYYTFTFEKFKIKILKNSENFVYCLTDLGEFRELYGSCKDNKCNINDFDLDVSDNKNKDFAEFLNFNKNIIALYNVINNKNVSEINLCPKFFKMSSLQHGILISKYFNKKVLPHDLFSVKTFKIDVPKNAILENAFQICKNKYFLVPSVNKIYDGKELNNLDYKLFKERFPFLEEKSNELIFKTFEKQIIRFHKNNKDKIFDVKEVQDSLDEVIKFPNFVPLQTVLEEERKRDFEKYEKEFFGNIDFNLAHVGKNKTQSKDDDDPR